MTYNIKTHELAGHFLDDDPRWLKLNAGDQRRAVHELAETIQSAIEGWLEDLADGGSGKEQ